MDDTDISRLFNELKKLAKLEIVPNLLDKDVVPFEMEQYKDKDSKIMRTFNEALDNYYSQFIDKVKEEDFEKVCLRNNADYLPISENR